MGILDELKNGTLLCDGGMGTQLQVRGLAAGELPGAWNVSHPDILEEVHLAYRKAGARIMTANTFGVHRLNYPGGGPLSAENVVRAGMAAAKRAAKAELPGFAEAFAGLDIGPLGQMIEPMGDLTPKEAEDIFAEVVRAGKDDADLIQIETMIDLTEAECALRAAKANSDLPVFVTFSLNEQGCLLTGAGIPEIVAAMESLGADAVGMNCGLGPKQMLPLIRRFRELTSLPLVLNPNAGLPHTENGTLVYDVDAEEFASIMAETMQIPVQVVGGCCGTTPEFIARLKETLIA